VSSAQESLRIDKVWSTLGKSEGRGRQLWEVNGFVKVTDPLMNRLLLKHPTMQRKTLKEVIVDEHEAKSADGIQLVGDIRVNDMAAESLASEVIDPCFKLRGMDVFLTKQLSKVFIVFHPHLILQLLIY
jgi:hypothetical protein